MALTETIPISAELRERFAKANNVLVLTGAGISAESGVPTFRGGGNTTVWKGMPFDVISSAGMLARDLPSVWEWFNYRRGLLAALKPNPAHEALALWQTRFRDLTLVTQNIDGLHQAAGSRNVIELHGNIWRARCFECGAGHDVRALKFDHPVPLCSRSASAYLVEVNPERTPLSDLCDEVLTGKAGEILPLLDQ